MKNDPSKRRHTLAAIAGSTLAALLFAGLAQAVSLTGADIDAIREAAAEFATGPLSHVAIGSACTRTVEANCSAEAAITVETAEGPRHLVVSKIDGAWRIGQRQRDALTGAR